MDITEEIITENDFNVLYRQNVYIKNFYYNFTTHTCRI